MSVTTDTGAFAMVPEWLLDADVSDGAIRLYATLARHADKATGEAVPSRGKLAKRLRCSPDTIDRRTKELQAAGALSVSPRFDEDGDRTSNLYLIHRVRKGGRTVAGTGSREDAAQNESHLEREKDLAPTAPEKARERSPDPLFEAVCAATGTNWTELTATGRGPVNKAVADLRALDVKPGQVAVRARKFAAAYPNATLTPMALAKHWAALGNGAAPTQPVRTIEEDRAELARLMAEEATR